MELRLNVPPQPSAALFRERTASAIRELAARPDFEDLLDYGPTGGGAGDRLAAAAWLEPRLGTISPDSVVICAGGASLLAALVTTFASPGDTIVAEALTYPGIRANCRHFGLSLVGAPMDEEGIVPPALAEICERLRPRILYCTPTIQNPTTATMSSGRRAAIAAIAEEHELTIIEDDAYGLLPDDGPPPLATFAPERTYYLASLSKCLSPGLRIAYCVGPEAGRARMTEGVRVVTLHAPRLMVAMASRWIADGSAAAILDSIRAECTARQAIARDIFRGLEIAAHPQGPHLWMPLWEAWDIPALGERLRAGRVAAKGDGYAVDGAHPNALRVGLGAARTRDELIRGLEYLRDTLRQGPARPELVTKAEKNG